MASIYGVTIAHLTKFEGSDQSVLARGTVCLNGTELGLWSQGEYGGPNIYQFDPFLLREPAQKYYEQLDKSKKDVYGMLYCQNGKISIDFCDILLADLVTQMDLEKEYMKRAVDGPCTLVTYRHKKTASEEAAQPYSVPPIRKVCFLQAPMKRDEIETLIAKKNLDASPQVVRIYADPEDFVIGDRPAKAKRRANHSR